MKGGLTARHYSTLTGEERFRLILAASGRGDEQERDRLGRSAQVITVTRQDHAPYGHAFSELVWLTFIELVEDATRFREAQEAAWTGFGFCEGCGRLRGEGCAEVETGDEGTAADGPEEPGEPHDCQRCRALAGASAYVLCVKAEGWRLFCEGMNANASILWEGVPGRERLLRDLAEAQEAALPPEEMLAWLNRIRPEGEPEAESVKLTAESVAEATERMFRERVRWWGGRSA